MNISSYPMNNMQKFVKKNVAAIHTSGNLNLLERKLANILLLNAYDDLPKNTTHEISLKHLNTLLDWKDRSGVETLKNSLGKLLTTKIEFNLMGDSRDCWEAMTLLAYSAIEGGICRYSYTPQLANRLYDPEIFAMINIGIQKRFKGNASLALYENCVRYKKVKSTGWIDLEKFKKLVDAQTDTYAEFKQLKYRIIDPCVKEINTVSDIQLNVEYRKKNRKVAEIKFNIEKNPQHTLLLDSQIEENLHIKSSDLYKRLISHGFKERLAFTWVLQDPEKVRMRLDYTEEQDRLNKITKSPAGYLRKLMDEDVRIGEKTTYELEKIKDEQSKKSTAKKKRQYDLLEENRKSFIKTKVNDVITSLEVNKLVIYINEFKEKHGESSITTWDEQTKQITNSVERVSFYAWLRGEICKTIEYDENEFEDWLRKYLKEENISLIK